MRRLAYINYLIILVIISSCVTPKTALKNFNSAEFSDAAYKFEKILKEGDSENNYLLAESLSKSNQLWKAAPYYKDAIKFGHKNQMAFYYLTLSLKSNGKYDEADSLIRNYLATGNNEDIINLMEKEAIYVSNLKKYPDTSYYKIKNLKAINTEFAEYSPSYSSGKLFFVSNRSTEKIYKGTGTPFTDLYEIKTKGAIVEINTLKKLDENINEEQVNEGSITFSEDGQYMIFAKGNTGKSSGRNNENLENGC